MSVLSQIKQARSNSRDGTARCFVPGCSFDSYSLHSHINRSHPEYCSESCPNCPAKFVAKLDLRNHQGNGCPRRERKRKTRNRKKTKLNRARVHHSNPYTCNSCLKSFVCEKGLNQHQRDKHHSTLIASRNVEELCTNYGAVAFPRTSSEHLQLCENFGELVDFSSQSKVNSFIKKLQLDELYKSHVLEAVRGLCSTLKEHMKEYGYSVNKIIKGGSLGKGTAVKGKSDIDCVIFFNNLKTMQEHKRKLESSKLFLKSCLQAYCSSNNLSLDSLDETPFAVKAKIRLKDYPDASFDVDLLPTFNADIEPGEGLKNLYKEILRSSERDRQFYSAAVVELQKQFVSEQPPNVKDLIRLVKFWRKTCLKDPGGDEKLRLPSSYPLELITIHCWEIAGSPNVFDTRLGFKAVLECLVNYDVIDAVWDTNYGRELVDWAKMSMDQSSPFVLDPANPANNVCSASSPKGWEKVAEAARNMLQNIHLKSINFGKKNSWG